MKQKIQLKETDTIIHILFSPIMVIYWIGTLFAFLTFTCNTAWSSWNQEYQKQQD